VFALMVERPEKKIRLVDLEYRGVWGGLILSGACHV
jgi:hypothetical protein